MNKILLLTGLGFVTCCAEAQLPDTSEKVFEPVLTAATGTYISGTKFKMKLNVTGNGVIHSSARFYAPEIISNPGNNTGLYYAAHFGGPILVEDGALINEVRTNSFRWKTDGAISFAKPSSNIPSFMVIKTMGMARSTSSVNNGLLLQDSVTFNSNVTSAGFNALHVNPLITQTGFTGITRGIYVAPSLTDVTGFRAIETNVPWGSGFQIYAGGTGRNYFRGTTNADSNWTFNGNVYFMSHVFGQVLRSNLFAHSDDTRAVQIQRPANPTTFAGSGDILRIFAYGKSNIRNAHWSGVGIYDSLLFTQDVTSARISALRVSPVVTQTGFTGSLRGLLIDPVLTDVTDFRAVQTEVADGKGFQFYAAGTAPSFLKGRLYVGDTTTNASTSYLVLNASRPASGQGQLRIGRTTHSGAVTFINSAGNVYGTVGYRDAATQDNFYISSAGGGGNITFATAGTDRMYIANSGYVGIGTQTPQSELSVNGTITTRRVKVTTTGWADYVFDSAYQLTPLHEVEKYVQKNKHLPEVPDAVTVARNGVDVGENQTLLLKKIEELTLYIIQQQKTIEDQEKKVQSLESKMSTLLEKLKSLN